MKIVLGVLLGVLIGGGIAYLYFHGHEKRGVIGSLKFATKGSGPVSFQEAQGMHRRYLTECLNANEDPTLTLRYLSISRADIDNLLKNMPADGKLRLYMGDIRGRSPQFSEETYELTTFLVGTDGKGNLLMKNAMGNIAVATADIVDNLPPCPDDCPDGPMGPGGDGFD